MMNARNTDHSRMGWAAGVRTAALIVVLGSLAAAWHPTTSTPTGSDASAVPPAAATVVEPPTTYFPSRFPAPEVIEPQAPTF
jgi:hypothetical protein